MRGFLAVKRHEVAKATEQALDYPAADWSERVDDYSDPGTPPWQ